MDINKLADKARKSISSFCFEECKSYCCRKGYLIMTKKELDKISDGKGKELIDKGSVKEIEKEKYSLYLGTEAGCPSLKDYRCSIHKSKLRPKMCREFPIFITEKSIILSPRCLAVKENKFYPFVKQAMNLGYRVFERRMDTEIYDLVFSR